MSLVSTVLRIATVYALRGQTIAGDRVFDSPQNPLATVSGTDVQIVIYTGERKGKNDGGRGLNIADQTVEMSIHVHLPERSSVQTPSGAVQLDNRQAGAALSFDLIWWQIKRAMTLSASPWAEVWRNLVTDVPEADGVQFMIETEKGARIAASEMTLKLDTLNDPPFGSDLSADTLWGRIIALLRSQPETTVIGDILQNEIAADASTPSWRRTQALLGLAGDEVPALGLGPVVADAVSAQTGDVPVETEGTLSDTDTGEALTIVANDREGWEEP